MQPRHETGTAGSASARAAIATQETRALGSHPIEVGRLNQFLATAAEIALRNVIAEDENEVGLRWRLTPANLSERYKNGGAQE